MEFWKTSPLLGAAYYPEDWDESEQERDIAAMTKAGLKVVRMAEFAWRKMEPRDGEFHFDWLHRVIERLAAAGIAVILGTPSATPPIWLEEIDPDMMILNEFGQHAQHGGRRNNCSNNPTYRKYVARITEKMAQEFGENKNVIGWQIDNEIYTYGNGCRCKHCKKKFAEYLKEKYITIDEINRRWNLNLFSQAYDSFEQIPMPSPETWHHPSLRYEWKEFCGDSHIDFIRMQSEILHRYTKAPIGTDMMQEFGVAYEKMIPYVDVIQFNHYDDELSLENAAFWFDYLRPMKEIPFWNTETSTCWNGGTVAPENFRPEGFCRANSWLPVILGGSANLYWPWRQHWTGHELMHGAVLYASGRPMHIFGEVQQVALEFEKAGKFISETQIVADTAMIISAKSNLLFDTQHVVSRSAHDRIGLASVYHDITESGIRPDLITPFASFEKYKLIFTPYLMTLEEGNLAERIERWVKDGGTWVTGPLTDIRNCDGAHFTDRETGITERLTGCKLVQQIPDENRKISLVWNDGEAYGAQHFLQLYDLGEDAQPLVKVKAGFSSLVGKAVVFRKKLGSGTVYVIGALPQNTDGLKLMRKIIADSGVNTSRFEGKLAVAPRKGENVSGIAVQEIGGKQGKVFFDGEYFDLLTGKSYTGFASAEPYQTLILIKK